MVGGAFKRFDLTLEVVGDAVAPEKISELLGVQATFAAVKGESRKTKGGRELIQPTGVWMVRQSAKESDPADAIEDFMGQFPSSKTTWNQVARAGRVSLALTVWFAEENGSAMLPVTLLSRMSKLGISLLIDVWRESTTSRPSRSTPPQRRRGK